MKRPKFSLGSWAFSFGPFESRPWAFEEFVKYSSDAGYDGIEINGFHPHPHPEIFDTKAKCRELKKFIEGYGLGISGYAPDFRKVPPSIVSTDDYIRTLEKTVAFCNHMGITTLRVDTISQPELLPDEVYEERFRHLANTWRAAAEICRSSGILLVWEFEPGFWLNKPSEIVAILEEVDHSNFKALFDTCHAYMCANIGARQTGAKDVLPGGLLELADKLENKIGHFHLIDSDGTLHDNETSTHSPFGQGLIDFKHVLQEMKSDIEGLEWWCFDFCFCPTTEKDAKTAIQYVENLLNQL